MPLDPQAKVVIDMIESLGVAEFTADTDPNAVRALMNAAVMPSGIELASVTDREIPGPAGPIPVRVYRPAGDAPKPVIVYFHGGGWVLGSLATHDGTCRRLADGADAVVVSVDYRMGPEDRFPAAVDDSYAALRWVAEHASELGGDDGPAIRFQLLIYPVTDHEFTSVSMVENAEGYYLTRDAMRWFYDHYLNDPAEGDDPRVSPLRAAELDGLPPAFVLTAQYDPLRDQG